MRGLSRSAVHGAEQAVAYVDGPARRRPAWCRRRSGLLFERFFDESGGMQLVVHAPFGTRINRAWGLALRKRFCRSFDFELQASADDNGIVLSLGAQHSFPLEQMFRLVPSRVARDVLVQAFLAVPFFATRWRWNVTRALQLKRSAEGPARAAASAAHAGRRPAVGRLSRADGVPGKRRRRHRNARSADRSADRWHDCLHEAADLDGWLAVLRDIESGRDRNGRPR